MKKICIFLLIATVLFSGNRLVFGAQGYIDYSSVKSPSISNLNAVSGYLPFFYKNDVSDIFTIKSLTNRSSWVQNSSFKAQGSKAEIVSDYANTTSVNTKIGLFKASDSFSIMKENTSDSLTIKLVYFYQAYSTVDINYNFIKPAGFSNLINGSSDEIHTFVQENGLVIPKKGAQECSVFVILNLNFSSSSSKNGFKNSAKLGYGSDINISDVYSQSESNSNAGFSLSLDVKVSNVDIDPNTIIAQLPQCPAIGATNKQVCDYINNFEQACANVISELLPSPNEVSMCWGPSENITEAMSILDSDLQSYVSSSVDSITTTLTKALEALEKADSQAYLSSYIKIKEFMKNIYGTTISDELGGIAVPGSPSNLDKITSQLYDSCRIAVSKYNNLNNAIENLCNINENNYNQLDSYESQISSAITDFENSLTMVQDNPQVNIWLNNLCIGTKSVAGFGGGNNVFGIAVGSSAMPLKDSKVSIWHWADSTISNKVWSNSNAVGPGIYIWGNGGSFLQADANRNTIQLFEIRDETFNESIYCFLISNRCLDSASNTYSLGRVFTNILAPSVWLDSPNRSYGCNKFYVGDFLNINGIKSKNLQECIVGLYTSPYNTNEGNYYGGGFVTIVPDDTYSL